MTHEVGQKQPNAGACMTAGQCLGMVPR